MASLLPPEETAHNKIRESRSKNQRGESLSLKTVAQGECKVDRAYAVHRQFMVANEVANEVANPRRFLPADDSAAAAAKRKIRG
jgi:hypothetical protein